MIRVNNQPIALQYLSDTYSPLRKIVILQWVQALLWLVFLITQSLSQLDIFGIGWWFMEGVLFVAIIVRRRSLRYHPDPSKGEVVKWRRQAWRWWLWWRYTKLLTLIVALFALLEQIQSISTQTPKYLSCLIILLEIPTSYWVLILTNRILLLLKRLNRVLSNFLVDFGEQEREDEYREKHVPPIVKIMRDVYYHG